MRSVTNKMLISLVGVALAAPFFVIAVIVGARAVALAHNAQDDLLLVALAFGGAAMSMINGFGRRGAKHDGAARRHAETNDNANARGSSIINLGY